ncbi:MAG: hypothetical protein Q8930_18505 [Bacillota bacterium]|nr:hypothetical protein [Bacillota bacterium]
MKSEFEKAALEHGDRLKVIPVEHLKDYKRHILYRRRNRNAAGRETY